MLAKFLFFEKRTLFASGPPSCPLGYVITARESVHLAMFQFGLEGNPEFLCFYFTTFCDWFRLSSFQSRLVKPKPS